jgi:hypothetical protein
MIPAPVIAPNELQDRPGVPPTYSTRTINDFVAAEMEDLQPTTEPVQHNEPEPYGMTWWRRGPGLAPELRAHPWFYNQVAKAAEDVLVHAVATIGKDTELQANINSMAQALREYIQSRTAINEMSGKRKFQNEMDDAAYSLCQSAKYIIDCEQRVQQRIARGLPIDDEQVAKLRERAEESMREGYAIAQTVIRASDTPVSFDFNKAARRVVDYSCRNLTQWFAQRRANQENEARAKNIGAALDLNAFFRTVGLGR